MNPNWTPASIIEKVQKDSKVEVPYLKAVRAKKKSWQIIEGNEKDQYTKLYDYLFELRKCIPNTTTSLKL